MKYLWDYTCLFQLWYKDLRIGGGIATLRCPVKGQCQVKCISFMLSLSIEQPEKTEITFQMLKKLQCCKNTVNVISWDNYITQGIYLLFKSGFLPWLSYFPQNKIWHHSLKETKNNFILPVVMQSHLDFKIFPRLTLQFSCPVQSITSIIII